VFACSTEEEKHPSVTSPGLHLSRNSSSSHNERTFWCHQAFIKATDPLSKSLSNPPESCGPTSGDNASPNASLSREREERHGAAHVSSALRVKVVFKPIVAIQAKHGFSVGQVVAELARRRIAFAEVSLQLLFGPAGFTLCRRSLSLRFVLVKLALDGRQGGREKRTGAPSLLQVTIRHLLMISAPMLYRTGGR